MTDISALELDLLLLCYTNSDDRGKVDTATVSQIAKSKLGVFLPVRPMTFTQRHLDVLTEKGILPPVKDELTKIFHNTPKRRKPPKPEKKSGTKDQ